MKIMCLNGWGGKLHEHLLPYVEAAAPEVLCLQEVVHSPSSEKDWLTYRDGTRVLQQRANFFGDMSRTLHDHVAIFCPAAQGVLWDGDRSVPSQWGLATFVQKSVPIVGQVQSFVHKSYSPIGYGDHPRSRSAHGVRLYDDASQRFIGVTHMHGLWDPNGKMDTPEREEQAKRLLDLSRHVSGAHDLAIICGDFNVEPDSDTLRIFADAGFSELVTSHGFAGTRSSHYKKPGRFADYMLINDTTAVKDFDVIYNPEVSDHCPLVLTL